MGSSLVTKIRALLLIGALFWPATVLADLKKPDNQTETLRMMADAYRAMEEVVSATIDTKENKLILVLDDDEELFVFPDNLHQKLITAESDKDRQDIFDFHIQATLSGLIEADKDITLADLDRLLPVIRHRDYLEHQGPEGDRPDPFVAGTLGDSYILYVIDSDTSVSYLTKENAAELAQDATSLQYKAQQNLEQKYQDLKIEGDGVYFLVLDGFYESSLVTFSPLWQAIDEQIGTVMMAVPARDLVIFVDSSQSGSAAYLRELLVDIAPDLSYPISDHIFEWRDDVWVVVE